MATDNEHSNMSDATFTKSFAAMIAGFVILTLALIALGNIMASPVKAKLDAERQEERNTYVAERIAPAGSLNVGAVPVVAATASAEPKSGKEVYTSACAACHGAGVAGAPKLGDKAAWTPRIAQGLELLVEHAIQGYQGKAGYMPPKGGNAALSDEEVSEAVKHMIDGM